MVWEIYCDNYYSTFIFSKEILSGYISAFLFYHQFNVLMYVEKYVCAGGGLTH